MTNELKNVPELRFPEFEGEWENSKLGTVANVYDGTHQTPKYTSEGIKFLSVENIKTLNSNKFISKEAFEKEFKIRPEFGDVLMTRIGDVGTPNVVETNEYLAYYVSLALLKPKKLNSYFLESLIRSQSVQNELWRKTLHIAFPKKINKNEIAKVEINYPEQQEQQKIGEFFSKLDQQIELEEQKLEKLEEQKKGYMQKLFSQELRFKDDSGCDYPNWKYNYLGNYMISHDEKTTENNQYPVLTSSREGLFLQKDYFTRDVASKDNTGYNVVPYGYFTYRHMSDDLVFKFNINYIVQKGIVSTLYPVFKTTSDLDNYFLKEILNNGNEFKKYALMQKQGGSRTYMYFSKLKQLKLHIPVLKEQEKISVFLKKLDSLIEKQSSKVELLKQRKKGFLQKMFV